MRLNMCLLLQPTYAAGAVLIIGACIILHFLDLHENMWIFGPAVLLGLGGSTVLITSLSITSDLIGNQTVEYLLNQS